MSLLATVIPMLSDGSSFQFTLAKVGDAIRIVTNPSLPNFQPDTTDAELRALQAALVMPLVITVPADDPAPDATLAGLLGQAHTLRQPAREGLAAFQAAQREAANAAKLAQERKDKERKDKSASGKAGTGVKRAATASTPGVAVTALTGGATDEAPDTDADAETTASESVEAAPAVDTPAPTAGLSLFADD
jgi:PRTRC genetic system protein E